MTKEPQSERLTIRVTPTDLKMLKELSEWWGLSVTNVIRQTVRREHVKEQRALEKRK